MDANEKTLTLFTTRIRQMILLYKDTKKDNNELYAMVDARDARIKQLEAQLTQTQQDYNSLKMTKMIEITDGHMESAQKRLAKLIREVDKCIKLLSDK